MSKLKTLENNKMQGEFALHNLNNGAALLPLFEKIDTLLAEGDVILALEGPSAAGKTTLSNYLSQKYNCNVFHTDDFFLQEFQRTRQRFDEPGGNLDRERFLKEVLNPLSKGNTVHFSQFDCSSMSLKEKTIVPYKNFTVVEGVYSMHPEFMPFYNLTVFLDIEKEQQQNRIILRNSKEMAKRYFKSFIPMEEKYFNAFNVKQKCDIYIKP